MRQILENLMVFHGEVGEMEDLFKGDELNSNLLSFYIYMYIHQVSISLYQSLSFLSTLPFSPSFSLSLFLTPIFYFLSLSLTPHLFFLSSIYLSTFYLSIYLFKYLLIKIYI